MTRGDGGEGSQPALWVSLGVEAVHPPKPRGESSRVPASVDGTSHPAGEGLWEQAFGFHNLDRALGRVERNGGAPGVDGMRTDQLRSWFSVHWPGVLDALEEGTFRPDPLRRVKIPKPYGGVRLLGVPTVRDRLVQQAILQVLVPVFDSGFSSCSYGFRPGRSAHQAVIRAKGYVEEGYRWAVKVDLERFFDRVNHDMVMARVARRVADKRLLKLIRAYLNAGVMEEGIRVTTREGTPQGSPLSPLLANIFLDDLDRELERRGHRFVRYADDVRIYVRTERAAERVLASVSRFIEGRLRLRVNYDKSGIGLATQIGLLGFCFFLREGAVKVRIDSQAKAVLKRRIRLLTARSGGRAMQAHIAQVNQFIRGWMGYYHLADTPSVFASWDGWLRCRLRQVQWRQWRRIRTRIGRLVALGIPLAEARPVGGSRKGPWRLSHSTTVQRALPNAYWERQGLRGFAANYHRFRQAADEPPDA